MRAVAVTELRGGHRLEKRKCHRFLVVFVDQFHSLVHLVIQDFKCSAAEPEFLAFLFVRIRIHDSKLLLQTLNIFPSPVQKRRLPQVTHYNQR